MTAKHCAWAWLFCTAKQRRRQRRCVSRKFSPFLRKFVLSAAQSGLFNHYLGQRLNDGLLRRVLPGDVMAKWPFGGMFVAEDVEREQARLNAGETVTAGPIFGRKTFPAAGIAAEREAAMLAAAGSDAGIPGTVLVSCCRERGGTTLSTSMTWLSASKRRVFV